ncbi:MAG: hypothetical protein ABS98_00595 [Lysobacteraceae bacterium SCN 69-48]|nr:MAG: hypothetical protein ABS98_00595 [Xanthomonadaceae bacterium SCN 69-48]
MPWVPIGLAAYRAAFYAYSQNPDVHISMRDSRVTYAATSRDNVSASYSVRVVSNHFPSRQVKYRITVENYEAADSAGKEGLWYSPAYFVVYHSPVMPQPFIQKNLAAPYVDGEGDPSMPSNDPVMEWIPSPVIVDTPMQYFVYRGSYTGEVHLPADETDTAWSHFIEVWVDDDILAAGGGSGGGGVSPAGDGRLWPLTPDWSEPVTEGLAWGTSVNVASATGVSVHEAYQLGPQRSFTFEAAAARRGDRQLADALLAGHRGAWLLPIFPDVQRLTSAVDAGDEYIPCRTDGFDFVAGGRAVLWASPTQWELVWVSEIDPAGLALSGALAGNWPVGTRLYPVRRARIQDGSEERLLTDRASRRKLAFDIAEPCDWPALESLPEYLTHPVLEARPDESEAPTASYARLRQGSNYPGAQPFAYDLADQALRAQSTAWKLVGRARHTWHRSLLYLLAGRATPVWLPSFAADLIPAAAVAGGSTALSVEWAGYTQLGKGRHNRRDLRIELVDGTVHYRRVTDAAEAGAIETLTLSAALDSAAIAPAQIRQVSFMALSTLAGDAVEITHVTDADGTATATHGWQAVVPDV